MADSKSTSSLQGFYRGVVLKHLANGCCKIWIPSVFPIEWASYANADLLPTAEQASPLSFGAANGLGIYSYPNIGSVVWCFFENGDQNLPIYFASTLGTADGCANWDSARASAGQHPDDAYVHKIHVKNSDIEIYETGVVKVKTENSGNSCALTMDADGNITLESSMSITLKTKQVSIDAETQIDMKAPNIKSDASVHATMTSPAVDIDSSKGHTAVKSRTTSILI